MYANSDVALSFRDLFLEVFRVHTKRSLTFVARAL
jgi:hypothetical protein